MAKVLLFNITGDKQKKLRFLCMQYGITVLEGRGEDCNKPLGTLLGRAGFSAAPGLDAPFSEEMLVLDGLRSDQFHGLLNGMQMLQAPVTYKAVTTDYNLSWTPTRLLRELMAEHEAMQNR